MVQHLLHWIGENPEKPNQTTILTITDENKKKIKTYLEIVVLHEFNFNSFVSPFLFMFQ